MKFKRLILKELKILARDLAGLFHQKRLEEISHRRKVQGVRCRQPLLGVGEAGQRRNFPYEEFIQAFFDEIALET